MHLNAVALVGVVVRQQLPPSAAVVVAGDVLGTEVAEKVLRSLTVQGLGAALRAMRGWLPAFGVV